MTNVDDEIWTREEVCKIYGLRWRIEIIFESWKSHFRVGDLPVGTSAQVTTAIYARLLVICIFHTYFGPLEVSIYKKYGKSISLLKLARFVAEQG